MFVPNFKTWGIFSTTEQILMIFSRTISNKIYSTNCTLDEVIKKQFVMVIMTTVSSFYQSKKLKHNKVLKKKIIKGLIVT